MIKNIIRTILFISISLNVAQYIIGGYVFDGSASLLLFIFGIFLLYFFVKPILSLVALPSEGVGLLFMSFLMVLILSFALTIFIPGFNLRSTTISELIIFGFVLPSKQLNVVWSTVFSSLLVAVMMFFLNWICDCRKK